jgi:hypothetical protein
MNRTFLATVVTAVAAVAMPALAHDNQIMVQTTASGPEVATSAGAPLPVPAKEVVPAKGREVSGSVVLSTPGEIVLRTQKGLQFFEITPKTQMVSGAADGESVTVVYAPARGSVSGNAVGAVSPTSHATTKVSDLALTVMPQVGQAAGR